VTYTVWEHENGFAVYPGEYPPSDDGGMLLHCVNHRVGEFDADDEVDAAKRFRATVYQTVMGRAYGFGIIGGVAIAIAVAVANLVGFSTVLSFLTWRACSKIP
jgi:hypothetical protein